MSAKCSNQDCVPSVFCHVGHDDQTQCPHWLGKRLTSSPGKQSKTQVSNNKSQLTWNGIPLKADELSKISYRNFPLVFGIVGKADAGKTTFLAMLYTLLLRGESFDKYRFSGSKTILGWDELYHKLKVQKSKVAFPDPTPVEYLRLHHLALKDQCHRLFDVFLSDASGEVFSYWSQNRMDSRAENARWVYDHAAAFILFIDCKDLIERKNRAKTEIIDIAQMLQYNISERPVITVWSKADNKSKVHETIKKSLSEELNEMFSRFTEIDISNFSKDDPDELVHQNNIKVIDWILEELTKPTGVVFELPKVKNKDPFLSYNGHE